MLYMSIEHWAFTQYMRAVQKIYSRIFMSMEKSESLTNEIIERKWKGNNRE